MAGKGITVKGIPADAEQKRILRRALELANRHNAPYKAKVALVEALIVESTARNLRGGDRDSVGVLQARQQFFDNPGDLRDPDFQIGIFLGRGRGAKKFPKGFTGRGNAIQLAKTGMKSGDIAQAIEGSAFPHRYQEVQREAMRIVRELGGTPKMGSVRAAAGTPATAKSEGVGSAQIDKLATLQNYLQQADPKNPLLDIVTQRLGLAQEQTQTQQASTAAAPATTKAGGKFDWVIGDSIAVGAAGVLKNAKSNAKGGIGTPAGVDRLKASNPSGTVLVSLGSNDDPRYPENFRKQVRRALKVAPNATLVWATTAVKGKARFNQILREEAARSNGRLVVADWGGSGATSDGVHPSDYAAYVRRVRRALGPVASTGSAPSRGGARTAKAQGLSPLLELFWQGQRGVDVKNGKRVPLGFVSGHTDHVHVAAGPKTVVRLGKRAQDMGLNVGENSHFNGGHRVTSGHVANSNHYRDEAIDVSGSPKKMSAFAHYIRRLYGL